jgi:Fe-S cluster biogenesis protein NfuA
MKRGRALRVGPVAARVDIVAAGLRAAEAEGIVVAEAGAGAVTAAAGAAATETTTKELLERIETVLDEHVRPDLRADGGGVVVVGLDEDNILQVRLTGACQGCSASIFTLTMRVEATLKARVREIRFVEAVP